MSVKTKEGDFDSITIELNFIGGGEFLLSIQKALVLGIEVLGTHKEHSGYSDHQHAVYVLSSILKQTMLNHSQTNVALGGKPYIDETVKVPRHKNKLEEDTSPEFLLLMKDPTVEGLDDKQLFKKFIELNPRYEINLSQRRFFKWLEFFRAAS